MINSITSGYKLLVEIKDQIPSKSEIKSNGYSADKMK